MLCKFLRTCKKHFFLPKYFFPQDLPIDWNEKYWQKRLSLTVWRTVTFQNLYSEIATSLLETKSSKRLVFQWTSQKHGDEMLWLTSLSFACFRFVHCNIFFFTEQVWFLGFFKFLRFVPCSRFFPTLISNLCSSRTCGPSHPSKSDRKGWRHSRTGYKMFCVKLERRVGRVLG